MRGQLRIIEYGLIILKLTRAVSPRQAVANDRVTGGNAKYASESEFPNPCCTFAITQSLTQGSVMCVTVLQVHYVQRTTDCLDLYNPLARNAETHMLPRLGRAASSLLFRQRFIFKLALPRRNAYVCNGSSSNLLHCAHSSNLDVAMACVCARARHLCSPLFSRPVAPASIVSRPYGKYFAECTLVFLRVSRCSSCCSCLQALL